MSNEQAEQASTTEPESTPAPDTTPDTASTDTDDLAKWKAMARKHEAQAKANAEAARRLAELEDAQKTETQRLVERAEKAERELLEARTTALIARAAKKYGIPDELTDFLSGAASEEDIEAKAARLAESIAAAKTPADDIPGKPKPRLVPGQGADASAEDVDVQAIAARIRSTTY